MVFCNNKVNDEVFDDVSKSYEGFYGKLNDYELGWFYNYVDCLR